MVNTMFYLIGKSIFGIVSLESNIECLIRGNIIK